MSYKGTKRQLAENIREKILNGPASAENTVDIRDIYVQLDRIVNKYAREGLFQNFEFGDRNVSDGFTVLFEDVKIGFDARRGECYSILPARYINLPHGRGIDSVFPKGNRGKALIPVSRNFLSSFRNSPVGDILSKGAYFPEGVDKIIYTERYNVDKEEAMDIRLVIAGSESIGPDGIYPIDPGMEWKIVQEVADWFIEDQQRPQDTVEDERKTQQ